MALGDEVGQESRRRIIVIALAAIGFLFGFRLMQMQVFMHADYEEKATRNSMKTIEDIPLRGAFYDRNLNLLAENIPAYTVRLIPAEYDRGNDALLDSILQFPPGSVAGIRKKNAHFSKFLPVKLKRGVDFSVIGWLEENEQRLPGVNYIVEMQRGYPDTVMPSHAFGYIKEISPKQLQNDDYYSPGDLVGFAGIERYHEKTLRGIKGYKYVMVDSRRREVSMDAGKLKDVPSIQGKDLVLGLDIHAQYAAEKALLGHVGAVAAIEPATGEVLAMASSPTYDLNEFSYITPREYLNQLYRDKNKPLINRATLAAHPPGSTFKILCALIALEQGVITENSTLYCGGGYTFGRFFKCHGSHGSVNVVRAIEHSCNTFFYQLIFKIGLDNLKKYSDKFGLGRKTEIDIKEEARGLIPSNQYYEKVFGKNWPRGIMVSLGIGQGEVNLTPVQLAQYTALIANNGRSYKPHIAKGYLDKNKNLVPLKYDEINTGMSPRSFEIVKQGMFNVVNGSGTATNIRRSDVKIAGKTGTAQNPHGKDHSLFIAYAPADNPKIAIAVLVENAGFGATYAAPIAQKVILSYLFKGKYKEEYHATAKKDSSSAVD